MNEDKDNNIENITKTEEDTKPKWGALIYMVIVFVGAIIAWNIVSKKAEIKAHHTDPSSMVALDTYSVIDYSMDSAGKDIFTGVEFARYNFHYRDKNGTDRYGRRILSSDIKSSGDNPAYVEVRQYRWEDYDWEVVDYYIPMSPQKTEVNADEPEK